MKRIRLPDLIVPDEFDHTLMCNLEVSICVRDRRRKDNGASGRCRTMSTVVVAGGVHEAWHLGLPMLISRINSTLTGELVWPADKPLPPEKPKAKPRPQRPRQQPKLIAPPPPAPVAPKPAPAAPKAPLRPATTIKPRPKAPLSSWANIGEYPDESKFQPPPPKGTTMSRTHRQPDPFEDERAPINTEYLSMSARRKREPVEEVRITGAGLAKRRIIKPKDDVQADIFDELLVED